MFALLLGSCPLLIGLGEVSDRACPAGMGAHWHCLLGRLLLCYTLASRVLAEKPLLDDVAFGVASSTRSFCSRWEEYTSKWWRPELNGVTFVGEITPEVEKCLAEFRKRFPGLQVADAPSPPPEFGEWMKAGEGERIIWSQIHILREMYPNKRSVGIRCVSRGHCFVYEPEPSLAKFHNVQVVCPAR